MKKEYQIKVYSKSNAYLSTINQIDIISNISFQNNINSWQWNITIKINKPFDNATYTQWNIIRITLFDDDYPTGKQVYFWFINSINRTQTITSQYIELSCVGIFWLLNDILFDNSWKVFTINDDPANIIKLVIDYFNSQYSWSLISYSWWHISNFWSSINLSFSYTTCFSAIQNVVNATNFRWNIDEDWQFYFQQKPASVSHTLTNQINVEQVVIRDDIQEIVNKLYLERNWWTVVIYQDAWSQSTYWIKETKETQTDIQDLASQDIRWNNYISTHKDSIKETTIIVNSKYPFEWIKPWQTIKILNFKYLISWLQVLAVNYSPQRVSLTLEKKISFGNQVVW